MGGEGVIPGWLKHAKTKVYPVVGKTSVCLKRDEDMGKCYIHRTGFITPNMPKLKYALSFSVVGEDLRITGLNPEIRKFERAYVFEKRDGFNCLFYEYRGKIIPKTRLAPIATGVIGKVMELPEFPMGQITKLVRDGYVPIFEVWGTKLDELGILHGCVDVGRVQEKEGLPPLNVDLIAVMEADYNSYQYTFLPPEKIVDIALDYGLNPVKFHGTIRVEEDAITMLMKCCEIENEETTLTEGRVLHCYNGEYGMFKVKPYDIMKKDVLASKNIIPAERIKLEIQKVLLETDPLEVARNPDEYLRQVEEYLEEDYQLTKEMKKRVRSVFVEEVASRLTHLEEPWKHGVHRMFIGAIKRKSVAATNT